MSVVYVETSALLAWLLGEPAGDQARARIDAADMAVTSVLTSIEAARALARAEAECLVNAKDAQALRGMLGRVLAGWMQMDLTEAVRERACRAFPSEPVRSLDAIHLATALEFVQVFAEIELVSLDRRVRTNAEQLGLPLGDPV